ncbi:DUF1996 domain-containing protein [Actinoplanes sp. NPDC049265]|uniref:DUF1996 domain-containing protein n=1 Tax=Actinoplanes sp. NPDC049265 TaxID=3363902 RepID=UPI00371CD75A
MRKSPFLRSLLAATLVASVTVIAAATPAQAVTRTVQAESYAAQSGVVLEQTGDSGGGQNASYLANGDWMRYDNVDLGAAGNLVVQARVASVPGGGTVELRTGSATGPLLTTFTVTGTGGWQTWATLSNTVASHPTGAQTVFAVLRNGGGDFVNINWFSFGDGTPGGPGWVDLDQAAWQQQLAQFNAIPNRTIPPNAVRVPEFNATCSYSHSKPDDPIVFPNMPGASHMHSFLGNPSTNAATTTQTLLQNAGTTCRPGQDLSAYWIPSLTDRGQVIEPNDVVVYYGSRLPDPTATKPFPQGFRYIAGDARRQVPTPAGSVNAFYCAGPGGEIGRSADGNWPICAPTANLMFQLVFPDCWDGIHLDSPSHKEHVAYTYNGVCSGQFPVAIPSVSFLIAYPTSGSSQGFTLASGMASSMHGDAWMAWDNAALGQRVKNCVVQNAKCNSAGNY